MNIRLKKVMPVALIIVLSMMITVGCKKNDSSVSQPGASANAPATFQPSEPPVAASILPPSSQTPPESLPKSPVPEKTKTISIVTLDSETLQTKAATATIPKKQKVTPKVVADAVVKNFEDTQSIKIGIKSVKMEGENVVVDFRADMAPVSTVGSSAEEGILDCISISILDNINTCEGVIFRVEGKAYESGHLLFDYDEVYNRRKE